MLPDNVCSQHQVPAGHRGYDDAHCTADITYTAEYNGSAQQDQRDACEAAFPAKCLLKCIGNGIRLNRIKHETISDNHRQREQCAEQARIQPHPDVIGGAAAESAIFVRHFEYLRQRRFDKAIDMPSKAVTHIQKMAPGPPSVSATAIPMILPVSTRVDKPTVSACNGEIPS